jgi:hypothetical protein
VNTNEMLRADAAHIELLLKEALDILNTMPEKDNRNETDNVIGKINEAAECKKQLSEKYPAEISDENLVNISHLAKLVQKKIDTTVINIRLEMSDTLSEIEKLNNKKKLALYKR